MFRRLPTVFRLTDRRKNLRNSHRLYHWFLYRQIHRKRRGFLRHLRNKTHCNKPAYKSKQISDGYFINFVACIITVFVLFKFLLYIRLHKPEK